MKTRLFILIFALVASAGTLFAESGTLGDNATWNYADGVLTISGTGAMTDFANLMAVPWNAYRRDTRTIIIEDGITHVGDNSFVAFGSLESVTIGSSVKSIGIHAFYRASNMSELVLPASLVTIGEQAFSGCGQLTEIVLPNGLTTLGDQAFAGCGKLTSVTIPATVTSIGENCFEYCSGLTAFNVDAANPNYASEDGVLFDKEKTTLLLYPINKPEPAYTVPATVTTIVPRAICQCEFLTSATIPASVASIGNMNLYNCYALTEIIVDAANASYSSADGVLFNKDKTTLIRFPSGILSDEYTIPATVTTVEEIAFADCYWLTTVVVPNTVETIGEYAFSAVSNVIYSGPATGAPWGAFYMNGYVDKPFIFSDDTKTWRNNNPVQCYGDGRARVYDLHRHHLRHYSRGHHPYSEPGVRRVPFPDVGYHSRYRCLHRKYGFQLVSRSDVSYLPRRYAASLRRVCFRKRGYERLPALRARE